MYLACTNHKSPWSSGLMELQLLGDNFNLQLSATLMHKCIQARYVCVSVPYQLVSIPHFTSCHCRLWDTTKHVVKQLEKIGKHSSVVLVAAIIPHYVPPHISRCNSLTYCIPSQV